jgi:hypothetical protein
MHLVGAEIGREAVRGRNPDFTDQVVAGRVLVCDGSPPPEDVVYFRLIPHRFVVASGPVVRAGPVRKANCFDVAVSHIDAEPVDPSVEPEAKYVVELVGDLWVSPVEVWLTGVE